MTRLVEMDPSVSFRDQLGEQGGEPIVLVNVFHVPPEEADGFVARWAEGARRLEGKPGFVSTQLHRGIAGSNTFLNYAVWATVADYRAAIGSPEVQAELQRQPGLATASPHLFRTIDVTSLRGSGTT